jgi:hypothetical protein
MLSPPRRPTASPFLFLAAVLVSTACESDPPSLSGIEPAAGPPGIEVTVRGDHLTESSTISLGKAPLERPHFVDEHTITGTIPAGLDAGQVDLVVRDTSGREMRRSKAFTVESTQPTENPCRSKEQRFTAIPPDGSVVKIDRHLPDGKVDRTSFPTAELEAIELRTIPLPDAPAPAPAEEGAEPLPPPTCSAIYLVLDKDRGRVLFDSDDKVSLQTQAQKIAQGLGKRLLVAEGMPE